MSSGLRRGDERAGQAIGFVSFPLGGAEAAKILLHSPFKNKALLLLGWHPTL